MKCEGYRLQPKIQVFFNMETYRLMNSYRPRRWNSMLHRSIGDYSAVDKIPEVLNLHQHLSQNPEMRKE